jgi:hypothetical protein
MGRLKNDDGPILDDNDNDSDIQLEKMGYKQELYRYVGKEKIKTKFWSSC